MRGLGRQPGLLGRIAQQERSDVADSAAEDSAVILSLPRGYPPITPRPVRPMPGAQTTILQTVPASSCAVKTAFTGDTIVQQQAADTAWVLAFSLVDLNQSATLTGLFDQYRFERVKVMLIPSISEVTFSTTATAPPSVPPLIAVIDYDDVSALGSAAAALEYDLLSLAAPYQGLSFEFVPKFQSLAQINTGGTTGGGAVASTDEWISTSVNSVQFHGLKGYLTQDSSPTGHASWRVYVEYVVSFKNVK